MRLRVVFFALLLPLFFLVVQTSTTHAAERLPVEAFAQLPRLQQMQLSPDGQHVAALLNLGNDTHLITRAVFGADINSILKNDNTKFTVNWFHWINNERLAVSVRFPYQRYGTATTETRLLSIRRDGTDIVNLMDLRRGFNVEWAPQFQDRVIDWLPDDPDHILMMADLEEALMPSVYRVDVNTGKREKVKNSNGRIVSWITDQQHRVRVGVTFKDTEYSVVVSDENGKNWKTAWKYTTDAGRRVSPIGFGLDPNILYVSADHENYESIFTVDLRDPQLALVLKHAIPNTDVDGNLVRSNRTGEVIGIADSNGEGRVIYWDRYYIALQKSIADALPKTRVHMGDLSRDEKFALVYTVSDTQPPVYYLFNKEQAELSPIGETYPDLPQASIAGRQVLKYKARDGVEIQAYLTLPKDTVAKHLPAVIFPHGGPMARDDTNFDYWAAFFANRGYAVLQMDFRSSSGYGKQFLNAGLKKWGLEMQDDITDGAQWLIDNGIADRNRLCIVGASYGGYAALMGAVKTPDLFRCAVSFAGVSDLRDLIANAQQYTSAALVERQIGTFWKDRARLKATSPLQQVEQIRIPILLAHGTKDRSVPFDQSEDMADALKDAGKNYRFIKFDDGDHYLSRYEHRLQFFKEMEAFLAANLGTTTAAPATIIPATQN